MPPEATVFVSLVVVAFIVFMGGLAYGQRSSVGRNKS